MAAPGESRVKKALTFLAGFVAGVVVFAVAAYLTAPGLMLAEHRSRLGLEQTVAELKAAAEEKGWVVSGIVELARSIKKHGGPDVRPVRLVNLCHAGHAGRILSEDDARVVSVMMPCTIAVYEKSDGSVWISNMNASLLGRLFGGVVSEIMAGPVSEAQESFLDRVR
jgi:uncharacterized protein (DUF302 family)